MNVAVVSQHKVALLGYAAHSMQSGTLPLSAGGAATINQHNIISISPLLFIPNNSEFGSLICMIGLCTQQKSTMTL